MSARRLHARSAALHIEVERREVAAATADKKARRMEVDADTWKKTEVIRQKELLERFQELSTKKQLTTSSESLLATWKDSTGEVQRKLMIESARASQRGEETRRRLAVAARERREAGLRQVEKEWSIKEESAKREAAAQQEADLLRWKRVLASRKAEGKASAAADKRATRLELESIADKHKAELRSAMDARKSAEEVRKQRAEEKRKQRHASRASELEEERTKAYIDFQNEQARRKKVVYETAAANAKRMQATLDRQQLKASLLTEKGLDIPDSLQEELDDLEKRNELARDRLATAEAEAKKAAEDVASLRRQLGGQKGPVTRGGGSHPEGGQKGSSGFF
jgi:hypothetical protein